MPTPRLDLLARVVQRQEPVLVQALGAKPATDRRFDFGRSVLSGPPGQAARAWALAEGRQVGTDQRGATPAGLTTSEAERPALATGGSLAARSEASALTAWAVAASFGKSQY